ncbi:hypothetical protein DIPPA_30538 [Diplonema papillatum]|nr:hypothetical protein DIPPA_13625 [Diplonema papillatum]KAJ9440997.1 hypothetical protein DIPPA_24659 [Diplonema papillatum]KAJ9451144.1 hypothetical protein DIPPA_30538 [Diplonema papillatum]
MPHPEWEYSRVVEASVHQTEAAEAFVRKSQERQQHEVASLRQRLAAMEALVQQQAVDGPRDAMMGEVPRRHPADVAGVKEWVNEVEDDPHRLVLQLEGRWVVPYLSSTGGKILQDAFTALRHWIFAASEMEDWWKTHHLTLGNFLLRQVLLQFCFVRDRVPRAVLQQRLEKEDTSIHEVLRAAASCSPAKNVPAFPSRQKTAKPRTRTGNAEAGGRH